MMVMNTSLNATLTLYMMEAVAVAVHLKMHLTTIVIPVAMQVPVNTMRSYLIVRMNKAMTMVRVKITANIADAQAADIGSNIAMVVGTDLMMMRF
jgi:hypothetical protein